ncbi:ribbon-helix-helix protein, CopG family [Aquincola sp. S2]|uniref:Ribbon-helix-helix protein, CopG family n=1 Tax=Pseudaquabacterium terrae TaxID=2732868 RepID=A0ABX2EL55_9BURK|nr:ribbon-helix-helix protein, CopG family [Aquabacterium terrae]NRF69405.1 ribbon-helix-helix protein, CopG family [Aquabacterium terrae]
MRVTVKLAPEMEQQLRRLSDAQGRPASVLIREALAAYLGDPGPERASAYVLGEGLFGKHRGPPDLAARRKAADFDVHSDAEGKPLLNVPR